MRGTMRAVLHRITAFTATGAIAAALALAGAAPASAATTVTDCAGLQATLGTGGEVVLGADLLCSGDVLFLGADTTLDLGARTLTVISTTGTAAIATGSSTLTVTGTSTGLLYAQGSDGGLIFAEDRDGSAAFVGHLVVEGGIVELIGGDGATGATGTVGDPGADGEDFVGCCDGGDAGPGQPGGSGGVGGAGADPVSGDIVVMAGTLHLQGGAGGDGGAGGAGGDGGQGGDITQFIMGVGGRGGDGGDGGAGGAGGVGGGAGGAAVLVVGGTVELWAGSGGGGGAGGIPGAGGASGYGESWTPPPGSSGDAGATGADGIMPTATAPATIASISIVNAPTTAKLGDTVTISVQAALDGGGTEDVSGFVELSSSVPEDVLSGNTVTFTHASPHTITAALGGFTAAVTIEVSAAPVLAATGEADATAWIAGAGAFCLLGLLLVVVAGRRAARG
ncbi:MAG: hypothetical protein J7480_02130 [Microbacteriaceae bacterium]|nr:hypothetical protein [Microbacteriaceae bacterium]